MRILVTGGAGFIGSHVVDALLSLGVDVRVLDLLDPAVHPDGPADLDPRAELVVGDVRDAEAVLSCLEGVDAVCHQAGKVGLGVDFGDARDYVSHNDAGTVVLLEAMWRRSFRGRLVLASSMVVYGEGRARCPAHGEVIPAPRRAEDLVAAHFEALCPVRGCSARPDWIAVTEDMAVDPRNVYAATKLHQEHLAAAWGREAEAPVLALRYHNVYGPRMPRDTPYAGVASIFRSRLAGGDPPLVFEDGGQTRDFIHVRDVARANVLALTAPDVTPGVFNIASGVPHTVLEMATALGTGMGPGTPDPVVTGAWRLGDVRHIVASARKATEGLGFVAGTPFEEGMAEFACDPLRAAAGA